MLAGGKINFRIHCRVLFVFFFHQFNSFSITTFDCEIKILYFTSSVWTKFRSPLFYSVSSSFNFFLQMNEINDFSGRFSFLRGEFEQLKMTLKTRYFALLIVSMTALGDITHLKIFLSSWEQWENTICNKFLSRFFGLYVLTSFDAIRKMLW